MALQQNFRSAFNGFNREDVVHYIEQVNAKHHGETNRLNSDLQYLKEQLARYELADGDNACDLVSVMEQQLLDQNQTITDLKAELEAFKSREPSDIPHEAQELMADQAARIQELEEKLAEIQANGIQADAALRLENTAQAKQIDTLEQRLSRNQTSHQVEVAELEGKISQQNEELEVLRRQLAEAQENARQSKQSLARIKEENEGLQALLDTALSRQSHVQSQQEAELSAYRRAERVERQARERAVQISDRANGILADATAKVDEAAAYFAAAADQVMQQIQHLQNAVNDSKLILKDASACLHTINPDEE